MAIFWSEVLKQSSLLEPTLMLLAFVFVLIGFGTKTGLFPMHAWLPDAHSEAPSPVSALLSAVLLNCALLVPVSYTHLDVYKRQVQNSMHKAVLTSSIIPNMMNRMELSNESTESR